MRQDDWSQDVDTGVLLAYLDGALDAETEAQIEQDLARSPALQKQLQDLARLQSSLEQHLHHTNAPSTLELGEYVLGLLSPEEAAAIEAQLAAYPHHAREMAFLQRYLSDLDLSQEDERPEGWTRQLQEQVTVIVASLLDTLSGAGSPSLGLAGVRGTGPVQQTYEAGDVQLFLEIQESVEHAGQKTILGLAVGLMEPESYSAILLRQDQVVSTTAVDESGNFTFDGIQPGGYELLLQGPTTEIVVSALMVE